MFRRYVFLAAVAAAFLSAPFPALADTHRARGRQLELPERRAAGKSAQRRHVDGDDVTQPRLHPGRRRPQLDLDKAALDLAVQKFGSTLQGADVAMFYYAGHGVQIRGANFLVPVGANPTREADVDFQMVDVGLVLRQMEGAGTRLNLVVLDACRNNPFGRTRLARDRWRPCPDARAEGTLISFATQPGNVALDGEETAPTPRRWRPRSAKAGSTSSRPSTRSGSR